MGFIFSKVTTSDEMLNDMIQFSETLHPIAEQQAEQCPHAQKTTNFIIKNRPANEIKLLTYNILMLPKLFSDVHQE